MGNEAPSGIVQLDVSQPIWDRFFMVAPLILVGSRNADASFNVAPKHMATPLGWENFYAFVCSPSHFTYRNIAAHGQFTVSFPGPGDIVPTSLAASPRWENDTKPGLAALETFPARHVAGRLVHGCYLYLECALDRVVDGFGASSLIVGRIVAASASEFALRAPDRDDADLLAAAPLVAYLPPGRFARIDRSLAFPFPKGMRR
jgi:flavin reductase (DIM6/NTAB) family NADH-FMN oxidoreductase RutF